MSSHHIIDRRKNQKGKSSGNRRRFLRRVRSHVKKAQQEAIRKGDIKSITSDKNRKVKVPVKDLQERHIIHDRGGNSEHVYPGNKKYITGDRERRPKDGGSIGGGASDTGEGEDEFEFDLTKDEYLDLFFEDLELPDMVKENIKVANTFQYNRAGYIKDGTSAKLSILRSMREAKGRRKALKGPKKKKLKTLEEELVVITKRISVLTSDPETTTEEFEMLDKRRIIVEDEIKILKRKIKAIPSIDEIDLRYNFWKKTPQPTTRAVMFCVMDVSGSMGDWEKEMSKRFFMLLYLFLTRSYERVELVFIRHHVIAKEVDEDEFFYSRETGGTLVSPALDMMADIINSRYPVDSWNIYGCQASDGDNWPGDTEAANDILTGRLLRMVQYYAYVEIDRRGGKDSDLWDTYNEIKAANPNFDMTVITDAADIYPVFRRLFEKKGGQT